MAKLTTFHIDTLINVADTDATMCSITDFIDHMYEFSPEKIRLPIASYVSRLTDKEKRELTNLVNSFSEERNSSCVRLTYKTKDLDMVSSVLGILQKIEPDDNPWTVPYIYSGEDIEGTRLGGGLIALDHRLVDDVYILSFKEIKAIYDEQVAIHSQKTEELRNLMSE